MSTGFEPDSAFRLDGRVAVVTGAARGFGRRIAAGFAAAGASVVGVDLLVDELQDVVTAINVAGGSAVAVRADVSSPADVGALFAAVDERFGQVDVLINNAGIGGVRDHPEDYRLEDWEQVLRVNLTSCFLCSQAAGRRMIARGRGGSIVNFSSTSGSSSLGRGVFAYAAAKSAIIQLTRDLAVEWAQHGIRVNAVQPCQFVTTGWTARLADPTLTSLVERVVSGIPLGRLGDPDEIVGPVLFLVSSAASMVTGVVLPVDGGNLAMNASAIAPWR